MNDGLTPTHEMDLNRALAIIAHRRQRDLADALLALDLAAATLNVIREDVLANAILDIKSTLKSHIAKESYNAMDLKRRSQAHEESLNTREAEAVGFSGKLSSEENRRRGLGNPPSELSRSFVPDLAHRQESRDKEGEVK